MNRPIYVRNCNQHNSFNKNRTHHLVRAVCVSLIIFTGCTPNKPPPADLDTTIANPTDESPLPTTELPTLPLPSETISPPAVETPPESKPVEKKPVETKPVETKPVETKPVETKPVETKPVETKPVETKPVETKPVETKPVETKPVETKPVETKPVETKPVETKPVETKPVENKPVETKPVETISQPPAPTTAVTTIPTEKKTNTREIKDPKILRKSGFSKRSTNQTDTHADFVYNIKDTSGLTLKLTVSFVDGYEIPKQKDIDECYDKTLERKEEEYRTKHGNTMNEDQYNKMKSEVSKDLNVKNYKIPKILTKQEIKIFPLTEAPYNPEQDSSFGLDSLGSPFFGKIIYYFAAQQKIGELVQYEIPENIYHLEGNTDLTDFNSDWHDPFDELCIKLKNDPKCSLYNKALKYSDQRSEAIVNLRNSISKTNKSAKACQRLKFIPKDRYYSATIEVIKNNPTTASIQNP